MLPGRVENWVVLSDFEKNGFGDLSLGSIKQIMSALTDNYRCRLGVNYVVNPAKSVYYIWTCVKPFLDDVLIEKVKILNTSIPAELFTHCNPYQVEEKYGGKSPNLTQFWPPCLPEVPYALNQSPIRKIEIQLDFHDNSAESELIDRSDNSSKKYRKSLSRDEKIFEEYEKDIIKKANDEAKEEENEEIPEVQYEENADEEVDHNRDNAVREERKIQKAERKERRRLRKIEKAAQAEKVKELENVENIEKNYSGEFDKEELGLDHSKNEPLGYIHTQEVVVGDGDKAEIGCGLCNTLPSFSLPVKKCEIF